MASTLRLSPIIGVLLQILIAHNYYGQANDLPIGSLKGPELTLKVEEILNDLKGNYAYSYQGSYDNSNGNYYDNYYNNNNNNNNNNNYNNYGKPNYYDQYQGYQGYYYGGGKNNDDKYYYMALNTVLTTYANNSQAVVIRGPIEGLKVSQATVDDSLNIVDAIDENTKMAAYQDLHECIHRQTSLLGLKSDSDLGLITQFISFLLLIDKLEEKAITMLTKDVFDKLYEARDKLSAAIPNRSEATLAASLACFVEYFNKSTGLKLIIV